MVNRCIAAGCSNTHKDGVSLFLLPKDAAMRKKWADQVKQCALFKAGLSKYLLQNNDCSVGSHLSLYIDIVGEAV